MSNSASLPNQLIREKSPYLLQHARNPVNWYPWGAEAFAKARQECKLIFLSIGYSTCHWCHVMAHESFEDPEVADALNFSYIAVKVDREERPDIDAVYMSACQLLTGSGGWPLTVIMTPEQKPVWAGTYLPKNSRYGSIGLLELLAALQEQWQQTPETILMTCSKITEYLEAQTRISSGYLEPSKEILHQSVYQLQEDFDPDWGGFGSAPKFPMPSHLLFLLQYGVFEKDRQAIKMAEHTLVQMYRGGIFDHLGGGFSRYSTDEKWLIPHFEKMLYDNALLSLTYLEGYLACGRPLFKHVAVKILDYVASELTDPAGGFYCGQDADSDGVEGKYYVFTRKEIETVLGDSQGSSPSEEEFCKWYDISEEGNFEGKNVPNLIHNPDFEGLDSKMRPLCEKLYEYRRDRTTLHKDDKILTSWNALMITAFCKGAQLLGDPRYLNLAENAQQFIARHLTDKKGYLLIRYRDGEAANAGQLSDYAFYAYALLELYQTTFSISYLQTAIAMAEKMLALFYDNGEEGFFLYASSNEQLITCPKEVYDGALPSGNSIAGLVLLRLSRLTGETKWTEACHRQLCFLCGKAARNPSGHCAALWVLAQSLYPAKELLCTFTGRIDPELSAFIGQKGLQNLTVHVKTKENQRLLKKLAPFTAEYKLPKKESSLKPLYGEEPLLGEGVYYLCENKKCLQPVYSLTDLAGMLE